MVKTPTNILQTKISIVFLMFRYYIIIKEVDSLNTWEGFKMSVDKNNAMKLWQDVFGNVLWASDCFGTYIYKDDYGDYDKQRIRSNGTGKSFNYGWDVDHIRPKSNFQNENDADFWNNYEPMHRENNVAKSDAYPHFEIKNLKYKIVTCDVCAAKGYKGYGILSETSGKRIDWKGTKNRCYKA